MEKLQELLEQCLGQNFVHMIISNPRKSDAARKIDVRPYDERGTIRFQFAEYRNNQVFHQNRTKEEALEQILRLLAATYRQMEFRTTQKQYTVLVSKKGKVTIKARQEISGIYPRRPTGIVKGQGNNNCRFLMWQILPNLCYVLLFENPARISGSDDWTGFEVRCDSSL